MKGHLRSRLFALARLPWIPLLGMCWTLMTVAVFPEHAGAQERVPGTEARLYGPEEEGPRASWQVGGAAFFTTGKYGTDSRTDTLYIPASMRRLFDNGDLTLVVPYLTVTSNCGVTIVSGQPIRTGGLCPRTPSGSGTFPSRVTESGVGDVLLIGRYYLYTEVEPGIMPSIMLTGRVKAPTADRDRGLGTGEWDEGGGLGLTKLITNKFIALADVGYTIIGKPPGVDLRNQWSYDAGLGYYFLPSLLGSVYYEEARALVSGFQNPRDIFTSLSWRVAQNFRLNAGFEKGLTSGAPEYGFTVGARIQF
jgi:outer membrane putative beta-barrel porin/alpha-amylase